jgi:transcriptional regulator with XRE-family HTH domain
LRSSGSSGIVSGLHGEVVAVNLGVTPRPRKYHGNYRPSNTMAEDASQIGVALKRAREHAGLSQAAAAQKIGIDSVTLSRYERGKMLAPRATRIALASLYRAAPEELGLEAGSLGAVPRGTPEREPAVLREHVPEGYGARHRRNLPLAVRSYLAELQLRLTKGGATEEEIDEAMELLRSPQVFTFYKGGAPSEYNEEDVLRGMKAIAEGVIIPELRDRGRKVK